MTMSPGFISAATSSTTLPGVAQSDGTFLFRPANDSGDEQKMLNIFYFCNYMHDFLFIIGFDEAAGNFQKINFANVGLGNDPVRARAHSGAVSGTANMSTGPDGQPPLMNMGQFNDRHTAFDADVVFHEYVHGLTNRLVGGRINAHALDAPQRLGCARCPLAPPGRQARLIFRRQDRRAAGTARAMTAPLRRCGLAVIARSASATEQSRTAPLR